VEVVASLSQGRTAAAQCGLFTYKSVPVIFEPPCIPVFLKLGSGKGCQVFRGTKLRNGGRVLLAVLNLYVRIEIRVVTLDINHSATDSTQTVSCCFNPEAS